MEVKVKSIINIFTIIDNEINLLCKDKKNIIVNCLDELESVNKEYLKEHLNSFDINLNQVYTYSKKDKDSLNIYILYCDIIKYKDFKLNGYTFIPISKLEKNISYEKSMEYLKNTIVLNSVIKKIYYEEFSLPEIQKLYEELLNKKFDRRNFRKKILSLNIVEDTNLTTKFEGKKPAKLYKFKKNIKNKSVF